MFFLDSIFDFSATLASTLLTTAAPLARIASMTSHTCLPLRNGLLAHWAEAAAAKWVEALLDWEEQERGRRRDPVLSGRIFRSPLNPHHPYAPAPAFSGRCLNVTSIVDPHGGASLYERFASTSQDQRPFKFTQPAKPVTRSLP
jgi:hypothetical protein